MICDVTIDLGYEDNMFDMFSGNVDDFTSLGYLSGYNVSLDPYCIYLADVHRQIMWNTSLISLLIFL